MPQLPLDTSVWTRERLPTFAPLSRDLRVDVLIVGGGLTGVTAAYLLASAGLRVALLERRRLLSGDTALTTAHVTPVTDARAHELVALAGEADAAALWTAGRAAVRQMERIINTHDMDCGWRELPGYLHVPFDAPPDADRGEHASLLEDARLAAGWGEPVELLTHVPLINRAGVRFGDQRVVDPARYVGALAEAAVAAGAAIFEQSEPTFTNDPERIECRGCQILAGWVVLATHNPHAGHQSFALASLLQTHLALYTTFALQALLPDEPLEPALYWDTNDPYRYLRLEPHESGTSVIAGGGDCKTGQHGDGNASELERWLLELFPRAQVTHRWSGQVIETPDAVPFIGEVVHRQWIATGFSGNGTTFGTLAAMLARDGILGLTNPWSGVVSPHRPAARRAPWTYLRENLDYPYYMLRRLLGADAGAALEGLARGEGAVLELDGQQVAASKDDDGRLHLRSATCTHLGCTVLWNQLSRTWDCPCHGSRFGADGEVLSGPADKALSRPG